MKAINCPQCGMCLPESSAFCRRCGLTLSPSNGLAQATGLPVADVFITIIGGIVVVLLIVIAKIHGSGQVVDSVASRLQASERVTTVQTVPTTPLNEPPQIAPTQPAYSLGEDLSILPFAELAKLSGKAWLHNGCFACDIEMDSKQSRWVVMDIMAKITVFRANGGCIESRLCPLQFVSIVPGEIYTISYSATVDLDLRAGDRWEWKIVEARGFPRTR